MDERNYFHLVGHRFKSVEAACRKVTTYLRWGIISYVIYDKGSFRICFKCSQDKNEVIAYRKELLTNTRIKNVSIIERTAEL